MSWHSESFRDLLSTSVTRQSRNKFDRNCGYRDVDVMPVSFVLDLQQLRAQDASRVSTACGCFRRRASVTTGSRAFARHGRAIPQADCSRMTRRSQGLRCRLRTVCQAAAIEEQAPPAAVGGSAPAAETGDLSLSRDHTCTWLQPRTLHFLFQAHDKS